MQAASRRTHFNCIFSFFLVIFTSLSTNALVVVDTSCPGLLRHEQRDYSHDLRPPESIGRLKIMSYNVENLYSSVGKHEYVHVHELRNMGAVRKPLHKPDEKTSWLARIIIENNPDILVASEVESFEAAEKFNHDMLYAQYVPLLFEGNDPRGIKIGFLIRKDLPYTVELSSHRHIRSYDPVERQQVAIFSRDVPAALFRRPGENKPFLIVLGNHAKSKRDRPGDPESFRLRSLQYQAIASIIKRLQRQYGPEVPIVLAGDFNTDTRKAPELAPLKPILTSAFDLAPEPIPKDQRITHSYHPREGNHYSQLDDFMISRSLYQSVLGVQIVPYITSSGQILPLPQSFQERSIQPSDHKAIILELATP